MCLNIVSNFFLDSFLNNLFYLNSILLENGNFEEQSSLSLLLAE
jgi:hypothetical protein